jgi:selenocysteine-specific elongation factor
MIHADENAVRSALRKSCRKGDVEEIAHDHFFARSAVEAMADVAIQLSARSPGGVFTAAQFRDRLDNGRKVAIQVLEYFDRHGFTIRRQDLRRATKARMGFFSSKQQMPV